MALSLRLNDTDITVVTPTYDIIKTCKVLQIPYISFDYKSPVVIAKELKKTKKQVKDVCEQIKDGILHFSHTQFDVFCFLLVQEYSGKYGKVKFHNFEVEYTELKKPCLSINYARNFIIMTLINAYFKSRIILKTVSGLILLGINSKFIEKNNIELIDNKRDYYIKTLEAFKGNQLKTKDIGQIANLLLGQNFAGDGIVKSGSLKKLYDYLANQNITIKSHPYMPEERFVCNRNEVPSYLPAELFFSNIQNSVLAVHSAALITASKFKNLKSVSLVELVEWVDADFKKKVKLDLITRSENKILFPESLDELGALLNEI